MNLIINRAEWLRGEGPDDSFLLRTKDNKRCCVGIYLRELGVPDSVLSGMGAADQPRVADKLDPEHWLLSDDHTATELYDTNDTEIQPDSDDPIYRDESEREAKIARLFAKHGVFVTFKG